MSGFSKCSALALAIVCMTVPTMLFGAAATQVRRAVPLVELYRLFSSDDYPTEALVKGEQGSVTFRLTVGIDGGVSHCAILSSSGSAVLDTITCQILTEKARFNPAANARGTRVTDTHTGRITWSLPAGSTADAIELPANVSTAMQLWSSCISGEASKLILSNIQAQEVAQRAVQACTQLEGLASSEMLEAKIADFEPSRFRAAFKEQTSSQLTKSVEEARSVLRGEKK